MAKAIAKPAISAEQKQKNKKQLRIQIKRHWMLYLFLLPCIVWLLVFCYTPMAGIVLAFKNYRFDLGIFGSSGHRSYFHQDHGRAAGLHAEGKGLWL